MNKKTQLFLIISVLAISFVALFSYSYADIRKIQSSQIESITESQISDLQSYLLSTDIDTIAELNAIVTGTLASTTANLSVFTNDAGFITASTTGITADNGWFTNIYGTLTGNVTGDLTGNADTATALAANGANCAAGSYPLGVDDSGAVEDCTDATTEINTEIGNVLDGTDAFTDFNGKVIDTDNLVADSADDTIVDFSSVTCTDITMTDCGQITSTGDMSVTGDITASATSTANVFTPGSDCYIKVSTSTTGIEIGCY